MQTVQVLTPKHNSTRHPGPPGQEKRACIWSDKNAFLYLNFFWLVKTLYLHCVHCLGVWWRETEKYVSQRRRPRLRCLPLLTCMHPVRPRQLPGSFHQSSFRKRRISFLVRRFHIIYYNSVIVILHSLNNVGQQRRSHHHLSTKFRPFNNRGALLIPINCCPVVGRSQWGNCLHMHNHVAALKK